MKTIDTLKKIDRVLSILVAVFLLGIVYAQTAAADASAIKEMKLKETRDSEVSHYLFTKVMQKNVQSIRINEVFADYAEDGDTVAEVYWKVYQDYGNSTGDTRRDVQFLVQHTHVAALDNHILKQFQSELIKVSKAQTKSVFKNISSKALDRKTRSRVKKANLDYSAIDIAGDAFYTVKEEALVVTDGVKSYFNKVFNK